MIRHARMTGRPTLFLPGLDHASIAAQFVLDRILAGGGREPPEPRPRALPRADARVRRGDARDDPRPGAPARRVVSTGAGSGSRWTTGRRRPSASRSRPCTTATSPTGPRPWSTGARAAGRASATSRSSRRPRPARCGRSATTSSTRRPASPIRTATITVATTRPETILGDTAVAVHPDDERYARPRRADASGSRSSSATCRSSPTRSSTAAFGTGAVKITPAHDHDDYETGLRHGLPMPTILDDAAAIANTGTRLRRAGPLRGPRRRSSPTSTRAATSPGSGRTRWSSAAASARTTSSSRA